MSAAPYPKRLIEVDLPIRDISAHARREKTLKHGQISTLHIWWARRPLAACRAVLCASLWPDPADEHCPSTFRDVAAKTLCEFAETVRTDQQVMKLCVAHWTRWRSTDASRLRPKDPAAWGDMRHALLDFIADFANSDASAHPAFVRAARELTAASHAALHGLDTPTPPTVFDPFAGGGSIPLEAARLGAEVVASDLNPVAVLINKLQLDFLPHYPDLPEQVSHWGKWVLKHARAELKTFYPPDKRGGLPVSYVWARTIRCEGPSCGAEVPLIRSMWLAKKGSQPTALDMTADAKARAVNFKLITSPKERDLAKGTSTKGAATCPVCSFTTPKERVRAQFRDRRGGASDARLLCVHAEAADGNRYYRLPESADLDAIGLASQELAGRQLDAPDLTFLPDEPIPQERVWKNNPIRVHLYGMLKWGDLFAPRQGLALGTIARLIREAPLDVPVGKATAIRTSLAFVLSKVADRCNSLARWEPNVQCSQQLFGRQAISMIWDYGEPNVIGDGAGSWSSLLDVWLKAIANARPAGPSIGATVFSADACHLPTPDDSASCLFTDPPYYDAVPYAALSDFFYVWLKRAVRREHPELLGDVLVPKAGECVVDEAKGKDQAFFQRTMTAALVDCRRVLEPSGIGVVVFAHKSTAGWEAQIQAMLDASWVITASWPIDTEMGSRLRAQGSAALASSVHLVCRSRELPSGALRADETGAWRAVLAELPQRIHDWMPRLAEEGVVGADAIFACLGPALEIFSRYSRVEKASGEPVPLKEYLEQVWAAVAREALSLMFEGADASGLEEDARLTAMWLWTLGAGANDGAPPGDDDEAESVDDDDDGSKAKPAAGFVLEYDAARKIAQGLGAHLEKLTDVAEVKGDKARLLSVAERAKSLFSKDVGPSEDASAKARGKAKPSKKQLGLFAEIEAAEKEGLLGETGVPKLGETTLDRVHQSMILFAAGRSEALKRFVVDEGVGKDTRYWKLAQSLSALYPAGSDEKRWVDGVLARKKGLGF